MTADSGDVLRRLAETLDIKALLEETPDLDEEGLRGILREAAGAAPETAARGGEKLLAFIDGAARGNPGEAGAGVVFKDPDGSVVERIALYLGEATNNVAEYRALLLALKRGEELGATSLHVYSDSELLVQQVNGRYRVRAPHLQELCQQAIRLMRQYSQVNISHVKREMNAEADEQANIAIDRKPRR